MRVPAVIFAAFLQASAYAQEPIEYRFSFPEPEHHWMQVEATFPDVGTAPLELPTTMLGTCRFSPSV